MHPIYPITQPPCIPEERALIINQQTPHLVTDSDEDEATTQKQPEQKNTPPRPCPTTTLPPKDTSQKTETLKKRTAWRALSEEQKRALEQEMKTTYNLWLASYEERRDSFRRQIPPLDIVTKII
jgi:hypothetical protein